MWCRGVSCVDDDVSINLSYSHVCMCWLRNCMCSPDANIVEPSATSLFADCYGVTCFWVAPRTSYHLNGGERAERHLLGELGCGWAARLDHRFQWQFVVFGGRRRRWREKAGRVSELFDFLRQTVRVTVLMVVLMAERIGRRWLLVLLVLLMVMGCLRCGTPNGRFRGTVRWDVPVGRVGQRERPNGSYQSICLRACNLWRCVILRSGESSPLQKHHTAISNISRVRLQHTL